LKGVKKAAIFYEKNIRMLVNVDLDQFQDDEVELIELPYLSEIAIYYHFRYHKESVLHQFTDLHNKLIKTLEILMGGGILNRNKQTGKIGTDEKMVRTFATVIKGLKDVNQTMSIRHPVQKKILN
jgi:hypothetical protein